MLFRSALKLAYNNVGSSQPPTPQNYFIMLKIVYLLISVISILIPFNHVYGQDLSTYKLGSGDLIKISIYGEPDLELETVLTDTGSINYPFLGSIQVKGLTIKQLENTIISGLKPDYLIEPEVHIHIKAYRNFYIYGEVKQPGGYQFQPGLTLRKAIALAGGLTARASKSKMYLISDHDDSENEAPIKLDGAINPGDIINIKQSFF